jgi:branched-chain amino acid transport system substrate-binding protein
LRSSSVAVVLVLGLVLGACSQTGGSAPKPSGGAPQAAAPAAPAQSGGAQQPSGGQQPSAAQTETLIVGAALPLTGDVAQEGKFQRDGYELWKDTVNAKGGIEAGGKRYQVDLRYLDYRSDTSTAVRLLERLITEDKAQFVFGPFGSGATVAASAVNEKYEIPMCSPSASSEEVYQKGYQYLFGILVPNSVVGNETLDAVAGADPRPRTMAIISRNDLFPKAVANASKAAAEARGVEVVYFEEYPIGATDLSAPLLGAKAKNPDILMGTGYVNDLILLTKQAKEQRVNPRLFVQTAGPAYPAFTDALGADANYIVTPTWWAPEAKYTDNGKLFGSAADFAKQFQDKYGYAADYVSAASSACGAVLQSAIERAGGIDPKKVRDAMASTDLQSFYGNIKFNPQGQNVGTGVTMLQIQNAKQVAIAPAAAATGKLIYPTPEWDRR